MILSKLLAFSNLIKLGVILFKMETAGVISSRDLLFCLNNEGRKTSATSFNSNSAFGCNSSLIQIQTRQEQNSRLRVKSSLLKKPKTKREYYYGDSLISSEVPTEVIDRNRSGSTHRRSSRSLGGRVTKQTTLKQKHSKKHGFVSNRLTPKLSQLVISSMSIANSTNEKYRNSTIPFRLASCANDL